MKNLKTGTTEKMKRVFLLILLVLAVSWTASRADESAGKKIKYWANPMNPNRHSDKPMKDEMGMDYVPVYEKEISGEVNLPEEVKGLAPVHISPYKEQLIDVKFATVNKVPVTRTIRTVGQFGGGDGDFAALAADFDARKPLRTSGRYVVADIYALDLPFVKIGQEAIVTSLSGTGSPVKGRVVSFYPYDQTQSRVVRAKIQLLQTTSPEIYANVEIRATMSPRLAVPSSAVMDTGDQRYVFVVTAPGVFVPRKVTIGYEGDDLLEVTSGLAEGDRVVDGALFMIDADSKISAAFSDPK